jgi:uncharacterized membrane protein
MFLAHLLLLAFGIGFLSGLRSMMPLAVTAWCGHVRNLALYRTPLAFLASAPAVAILTLGAVAELVVDKLPRTPARTAAPGLVIRFLTGGLCGAALVLAHVPSSWIFGAVLGATGGVVGAFAGYKARTSLVRVLGVPDLVIALAEDAFTLAASIFVVIHA